MIVQLSHTVIWILLILLVHLVQVVEQFVSWNSYSVNSYLKKAQEQRQTLSELEVFQLYFVFYE